MENIVQEARERRRIRKIRNRVQGARFRAREFGLKEHFSFQELMLLIKKTKGYCTECEKFLGDKLTIDHIIPFEKEGKNTIDNIQLLCIKCNKKKGNN